jgi:hypothetical protein
MFEHIQDHVHDTLNMTHFSARPDFQGSRRFPPGMLM